MDFTAEYILKNSSAIRKQISSLGQELNQSETEKSTSKARDNDYNIAGMVDKVAHDSREMEQAIRKLSENTKLISQAIEKISSMSRNVSSEAETVSAATEEQTATMHEIAAASRKLTEMANSMEEAVGKFKI